MTKGWIEFPDAFLHIFFRNQRKGPRVFSFVIDQENAVKNLQGLMGIHRGAYFGNTIQVAVDEFTEPAVIIHGSCS
jgi:hypothetical protein